MFGFTIPMVAKRLMTGWRCGSQHHTALPEKMSPSFTSMVVARSLVP